MPLSCWEAYHIRGGRVISGDKATSERARCERCRYSMLKERRVPVERVLGLVAIAGWNWKTNGHGGSNPSSMLIFDCHNAYDVARLSVPQRIITT